MTKQQIQSGILNINNNMMSKNNNVLNLYQLIDLYLAKRSAKKSYLPCSTKMQHHIEHSLQSLNLLLSHIDDFQLEAD